MMIKKPISFFKPEKKDYNTIRWDRNMVCDDPKFSNNQIVKVSGFETNFCILLVNYGSGGAVYTYHETGEAINIPDSATYNLISEYGSIAKKIPEHLISPVEDLQ